MIPLYKIFMPEDVRGEIDEVVFSGNLTYGNHAKLFESKLREYVQNPFLLTTANNNYASIIALSLIDLKRGDEVIASPMACLASNQPLVATGAKVIWADIDPITGTLNPDDVKARITRKTKVILHYHWCGYPGYIDEINQLGKDFGIYVIDDAIESFGSEYKGKKLGNCGSDITLFSFQAVRLPNTIDGGALAFSNKTLFERATKMRDWGINRTTFRDKLGEISPESDISDKGYNALMNELSGMIGVHQMRHLNDLIEKQRKNAEIWNSKLNDWALRRIALRQETNPNYWVYTTFSSNPDNDIVRLRNLGLYTSRVHIRNDNYSCFGVQRYALPGVDQFASSAISIPSGWWFNADKF